MKSIAWETAFQVALRNSSKESRGKSKNRWFLWRGSPCNPALIFCRRLLLVMKDFSAFLGMRKCETWAHKIFSWKYLTTWRLVLPVFFRMPHSWCPPWTLFRRCWSQHLLELRPCRLKEPMASANLWVTHRVLKTVLGTSYFSVNLIAIDVDIDVFSHDSVGTLFNKTIELRSVEVKCVHIE